MAATRATAQMFSGDPVVRMGGDGRFVTLVQDFSFRDAAGQDWFVPKGTVVDGASIPQPFWPFVGGPFEGKFRNASIIHDHYCVTRSRPWRAVHRVFYDGMIAGGVDTAKAKLMYFAVYKFGPRWEVRRVMVSKSNLNGPPTMQEKTVAVALPTTPYDESAVQAAIKNIDQSDPSLDDLDRLADSPAPQ